MRDAVKSYWYHDKMIEALEDADWMQVKNPDEPHDEFVTTDAMRVLEELVSANPQGDTCF